eukprot:2868639-Rhodomonas_salina.1
MALLAIPLQLELGCQCIVDDHCQCQWHHWQSQPPASLSAEPLSSGSSLSPAALAGFAGAASHACAGVLLLLLLVVEFLLAAAPAWPGILARARLRVGLLAVTSLRNFEFLLSLGLAPDCFSILLVLRA